MPFFLNDFKITNKEQIIFYMTLALAFILPLSRAGISLFVISIIVVWFLDGKLKEKFLRIRKSKVLMAVVLFISFQAFTLMYSSDYKEALNIIRLYSYWLLIFALATTLKKEQVPLIITAFLYGMFISEIGAYIIFFDIYPINGKASDYPSPFMHHIEYSVFLALGAALLLNRLFSSDYSKKEKAFMAFFFITITVNLFISNGRTGQLAFLTAMLVTTVLHFRISLKSLAIFSFLSVFIFYGAYKTLPLFETRVHAAQKDIHGLLEGNFNSSWGIRSAYWLIAYEVLKENPLLGVGIGDYKNATKKVLETNRYNFSKPVVDFCSNYHYHNQYLMILVQSGILGFLTMLYLFYRLATLKIDNQELKKMNVIFLSIFISAFMAESLWLRQFSMTAFVVFCALMIASSKKEKNEL